ncbi:MAG: MOSC domain-containing protein [Bryobacteraceae bacterium]
MQGTILQVSISPGGIPKRSIPCATVTRSGIAGDQFAHPRFHGGPDQALLLVCLETILELQAKGYPLFPGALGENLTISGIDRRDMRIGQRFRAGATIIELTKVRRPCETLDVYGPDIKEEIYDKQVKSGDAASPKWGMSGFYAAVIQTGEIRAQDIIVLLDHAV